MKRYDKFIISTSDEGLTIEVYMKEILGYSGRRIQKLTRKKGILLNHKTAFLQRKIKTGDILEIRLLEDRSYGVQPEPGVITILYEDEEIIVLNKPANLLVHPTGQTIHSTLANYLAYYFEQTGVIHTIRPLHRLDRETTGCIVFAKDARTQALLEQQLQEGKLKRTYLALVKGIIRPSFGTIDAPIGIHPKMQNRRIVNSQGDQAITHYKVLEIFKEASLLELTLDTGRTHQIRVHLAHVGHPIIGDRMYGSFSSLISRQALHASFVSFTQPFQGSSVTVEAPIPEDFSYLMKVLRDELKGSKGERRK